MKGFPLIQIIIKRFINRMTCNHQYKCIYLASKTEDRFVQVFDNQEIYKNHRIVIEYEFECTGCGKRVSIPMDWKYQLTHNGIN